MTEMKIEQNTTTNDAMNDAMIGFYNLKGKYEKEFYDKYVKDIIKSKGLSKREKRVVFSKLPKPK